MRCNQLLFCIGLFVIFFLHFAHFSIHSRNNLWVWGIYKTVLFLKTKYKSQKPNDVQFSGTADIQNISDQTDIILYLSWEMFNSILLMCKYSFLSLIIYKSFQGGEMGCCIKCYIINKKMGVWNPAPKKTSGRCADPCVTLICVLTYVYVVLGRWRPGCLAGRSAPVRSGFN